MYTPHTVTVYNVIHETDRETLKDETFVYATVLRGVFLEAAKAVNVRKSGLEGADSVNLYIPFSVNAVDGVTGKARRYVGPQEYWKASDRSELWTLSVNGNGGDSFFIKGEFVTDNQTEALAHDDCYNVTKVDAKDFGSPDMQHWEVGGV